jgi:hypothetical protein
MDYAISDLAKVLKYLDNIANEPKQLRPSRIAINNRTRWVVNLAMYFSCQDIASLMMHDLIGHNQLKTEMMRYRYTLGLPPIQVANENLPAVIPPFRGKHYRFDDIPKPILKKPLNKREIDDIVQYWVSVACEMYPDQIYDPVAERAHRKYLERMHMWMQMDPWY